MLVGPDPTVGPHQHFGRTLPVARTWVGRSCVPTSQHKARKSARQFRYRQEVGLPTRHKLGRWSVVLIGCGLLASLPALAQLRPHPGQSGESAMSLLARIRASSNVAYSGYAESHGSLPVPDVAQLGDLPALLGDTTKMRVWALGTIATRVDDIDPLGETDTYVHGQTGGTNESVVTWNSQARTATTVTGTSSVRAPRAGDLLPSSLGRRLVADIEGTTTVRIASRRVAGRTAQGVRLQPEGTGTIDHVDIWADTATGLPLAVEITPLGASRPALATTFLDLSLDAPKAGTTEFTPPSGSVTRQVNATDLQGLLGRLLLFPYPTSLGNLPATQEVRGLAAVATYGNALRTIVVTRLSPNDADRFARATSAASLPVTDIDGAQAQSIDTPLVNALLVRKNGVDFLLAGTVPLTDLRSAYETLSTIPLPQRRGPERS